MALRLVGARPGPAEPLKLIPLHDMLFPIRPDRLVAGIMGESTLAVAYGPPGCGKSFLAFDLAMHIAMGREWFGRRVQRGAVLYCAAEGAAAWNNRVIAFARHYGLDSEQIDALPIAFVREQVNLGPLGNHTQAVIDAAFELQNDSNQPLRIIILDTVARAMVGASENDPIDMGAFVANCDRIRREAGGAVLLVHHTGKSIAGGARGHSSLLGAVDTEIEVERRKNGDADGRLFRLTKARDGSDGEEFGFSLKVVTVGDDEEGPITSCAVLPGEVPDAPFKPKRMAKWQRALSTLSNTLAQFPTTRPDDQNYPNTTLTTLQRFRKQLQMEGVTSGDNDATERSDWKRIRDDLMNKGYLRIYGEYCWRAVAL